MTMTDTGSGASSADPAGLITTDQIGVPPSAVVGADIAPLGPVQDMWAFDGIAGVFPPRERDAPPGDFSGGTGGGGLGGSAEGLSPGGVSPDGSLYPLNPIR